jgi:hypothetical protein
LSGHCKHGHFQEALCQRRSHHLRFHLESPLKGDSVRGFPRGFFGRRNLEPILPAFGIAPSSDETTRFRLADRLEKQPLFSSITLSDDVI